MCIRITHDDTPRMNPAERRWGNSVPDAHGRHVYLGFYGLPMENYNGANARILFISPP